MSRESDLQALYDLNGLIRDMSESVDKAYEKRAEFDKYKEEYDNTKFSFSGLPTNNEETAKQGFFEAWRVKYSTGRPLLVPFLLIYSLLVLAFTAVAYFDIIKYKGILFPVEKMLEILVSETGGTPMVVIIMYPALAVFAVACALLPWSLTGFRFIDSLHGRLIAAFVASGVAVAYVSLLLEGVYLLGAYIGLLILAFIIGKILKAICAAKAKKPKLSAKQMAALSDEAAKDAAAAEQNAKDEAAKKAEWDAWWAKRQVELRDLMKNALEESDAYYNHAKECDDKCRKITVLGEDEMSLEVIGTLIGFIESHRADSIKEALHEYDNMRQNQKLLEIEVIKAQAEIEKARQEEQDRRRAMEMEQRHQMEMERQAARAADWQAQAAADAAAARREAERARKKIDSAINDLNNPY
ncbi:MAG: hypothetical protein IKD06_01695 [Clostridia bacterium]|nr:hypothetical protein [Clostridia bacterium]